jgi:hypothetical protein
MTAQLAPSQAHDRRSGPLAAALEQQGLVDPRRHDEVVSVIDRALSREQAEPTALRRRLVELAAYVGAAFVVAAGILFATQQWNDLSVGQQVGLLAGVAVLLLGAGVSVALTGGGPKALRAPTQDVRRRLASVLVTGGAGTAAAAVGVWMLDVVGEEEMERGWQVGLAGSATLLLLSLAGYVVAPSALGQLAAAAATMYLVPFAYEGLDVESSLPYGLTILAVGLLWMLLAERRVWREQLPAQVVGGVMALFGSQLLMGLDQPWPAYLLTLLVAALGFTMYVVRRAWPYLAVGVVGVTVAVPEALLDWTGGSLGTAGVLLVAGVTLLGASLLGLRLRKETAD